VFLHWSWFLVAFYQISTRQTEYSTVGWVVLEYLTLFLIVLLHEFGHAFACRSVKGTADRIVLWPLGGLAFVSPPPRPGALLWSIAAGPLVNVVLAPILIGLWALGYRAGWPATFPDLYTYIEALAYINTVLLIFNILPIYPLDGGQILQSLLWFPLGRGRSLQIASGIGIVAGIGAGAYILWRTFAINGRVQTVIWYGVMIVFLLQRCFQAFKMGRIVRQIELAPKHADLHCPTCDAAPPSGPVYSCRGCGSGYDPFVNHGRCPRCSTAIAAIVCPHCGAPHRLPEWGVAAADEPPETPPTPLPPG
jgi:Zn-dependent protease